MPSRIALLAAVLAAAVLAGSESRPPAQRPVGDHAAGYASAYAPGVMEATVRYRLDAGVWRTAPPADWYLAAGAVAALDCSRVGEMATLITPADGRAYRVLIADCAGNDGPADRFTVLSIITELDAGLWDRLTALHGRPLAVELHFTDPGL